MCVTHYVIYEIMHDNTTLFLYKVTNNHLISDCAAFSSVPFTQFCSLHFVAAHFAAKDNRQTAKLLFDTAVSSVIDLTQQCHQ